MNEDNLYYSEHILSFCDYEDFYIITNWMEEELKISFFDKLDDYDTLFWSFDFEKDFFYCFSCYWLIEHNWFAESRL
jgi:predicted Rdx family selenoprotein